MEVVCDIIALVVFDLGLMYGRGGFAQECEEWRLVFTEEGHTAEVLANCTGRGVGIDLSKFAFVVRRREYSADEFRSTCYECGWDFDGVGCWGWSVCGDREIEM